MGRRGCRQTSSREDRQDIFSFVVWEQDAHMILDWVHVQDGLTPGHIASYFSIVFANEFKRELVGIVEHPDQWTLIPTRKRWSIWNVSAA